MGEAVRVAGAGLAPSALFRVHRLSHPSHSGRRGPAASVPVLRAADLLVLAGRDLYCIYTRVSSTEIIFASKMIHLVNNRLKV
jgi:hypothetical protein